MEYRSFKEFDISSFSHLSWADFKNTNNLIACLHGLDICVANFGNQKKHNKVKNAAQDRQLVRKKIKIDQLGEQDSKV